jgi:hypothetical protein
MPRATACRYPPRSCLKELARAELAAGRLRRAQSQNGRGAEESGKRSELVVFEGLVHALEDSDARALMLSKAAALLAETTDIKTAG